MFTYKTFTVLVMGGDPLGSTRYDIMAGYEVLKSCKTAGSAKGWITRNINNGNIEPLQ